MKLPDHAPNQSGDRTEEEREFFALTEESIWEEARDRLNIASEFETDNRKRAKMCMLFREGDQWDHDIVTTASEDSPELTINLTDAFCTRVENNIRQQRPQGKCHPVGDGADVEVAEVINGIGRHIEMRSDASIAYDTAASCALTGNVGFFRLIAEYIDPRSFQKDLRILPIRNPFTVSMDPSAIMPDGRDQTWCILSVKMKRTEYKMRFPDATNAAWNDLTRDEPRLDWEDKEEIRLAEYFRIREKEEKLYLIRNPQTGEEFTRFRSELPKNDQGRVSLPDAEALLALRGLTIEGSRDSLRHQVEWFRLNGLKVVERAQLPGTWIPVFRVEGNARDIDGRVRRRGMIDFLMDPQRMVNYGEVAKIKRLGLAPKAPWVGAEGQFDGHPEWNDANQKPYSVLTYKPITVEGALGPVFVPPPQRQPPAQIEAGFSEFVQGMRSNLLAVAGMPNEPGADPEGVVVSGRAIQRRQWLSDQSHYQYYDNLTLAIAHCWRVMIEWIPYYFSESRMQRIVREDGTSEMVPLNRPTQEDGIQKIKNDLSVGRYDVVMDTGPGYDTKREEGAENLIRLLGIGPLAEIIAKTGADLVFRSIDHPYMQQLADRLMAENPEGLQKIMEGLSSRARSVVQSLANENQALKARLQQLEIDLKTGITKAHLAATAKAHDTETRAQTTLAVEEIRAGGKLLDSHLGHAQDRELLERQLLADAVRAATPTGEPQ